MSKASTHSATSLQHATNQATGVVTVADVSARRLDFLDAARASAMLFVMMSHFATIFPFAAGDFTPVLLEHVGMAASPTFMIINGLLVGFVFRMRPERFAAFRLKLVDRGLFLLTVGHALILGAHVAKWHHVLSKLFITDVIGVCMICSPWLVQRLAGRHRVVLGLAGLAASWFIAMVWHPLATQAEAFQVIVFGAIDAPHYTVVFPLVPWFSFEILASVFGERVATVYCAGGIERARALLLQTATSAMTGSLIMRGAVLAVRAVRPASAASLWFGRLNTLTSFFQKAPPAPGYLLFQGSIGLLLVAWWLTAEQVEFLSPLTTYFGELGQSSFVMFVLQFYMYFTAMFWVTDELRGHSWAWLFYFVISVGLVVIPTREWHRRNGNRLLTIGFARGAGWHRAADRDEGRVV